jgi:hypothetical protein
MDTSRKTAVGAGVLFITATVASVLGTQLSAPVLSDSNYLTRIAANLSAVQAGALLELIAAGACAGIAISLYPVLSKWSPVLALGSVAFRTIEAVMYMCGVVSLLSVVALSEHFSTTAVSDRAPIQATADALLVVRAQAIVPAVLAFSLGAFMYYYVLYRADLVPKWPSGWGIAAIILTIAACLLAWFSRTPLTTYTIVLLPIAIQEMVLAIWLIVKGFNPSALQSAVAFGGSVAMAVPKSMSQLASGITSLS